MKLKDDRKVELIFEAALKLVANKGLSGITMGDISREAGIATGTLYVYFTGKDELINALFEASRANSVQVAFRGYELTTPFKLGFRTVWMNILRYKLQHFEEVVFLEQCYHSPYITEGTREKARELAVPFFDLIERGQQEMLIKTADTGLLLTFMMGAINELVKQTHYSNETLSKKKIDLTFDLCWDALKA